MHKQFHLYVCFVLIFNSYNFIIYTTVFSTVLKWKIEGKINNNRIGVVKFDQF